MTTTIMYLEKPIQSCYKLKAERFVRNQRPSWVFLACCCCDTLTRGGAVHGPQCSWEAELQIDVKKCNVLNRKYSRLLK